MSPRSHNLVFLGPPGAGKGTQAARWALRHGLAHISTGDLLRENLKDQTSVGMMAQDFMDRGVLVPDDVVCQMVRDRLEHQDTEPGFILDGFPRTVGQADALARDLARRHRPLTRVVSFAVREEDLVVRLAGRLTCGRCGRVFHQKSNAPKAQGVCDDCDGELFSRSDDSEETVLARLATYREETAPLLSWYRDRDLLTDIDASQSIEAVEGALERALECQ
ncbi:MAG: adenylate kinase [Planctomycetes bacterium]|nr:adenylate kinase [Planctomycetota bacterium]